MPERRWKKLDLRVCFADINIAFYYIKNQSILLDLVIIFKTIMGFIMVTLLTILFTWMFSYCDFSAFRISA